MVIIRDGCIGRCCNRPALKVCTFRHIVKYVVLRHVDGTMLAVETIVMYGGDFFTSLVSLSDVRVGYSIKNLYTSVNGVQGRRCLEIWCCPLMMMWQM